MGIPRVMLKGDKKEHSYAMDSVSHQPDVEQGEERFLKKCLEENKLNLQIFDKLNKLRDLHFW